MSKTAKTIADEVLTPARVRELWTANYLPALPFTPQNFDIGTLLPAMLYMARWGQRRGKGAFKEAFGSKINGKAEPPTIKNVASGLLAKQAGAFDGFGDPYAQSLLADLLLTYCLENKGHEEGHDVQVQRVFATHYMASWVDLPDAVAHLRGVPELLTALLAWTSHGEAIQPGGKGQFIVGDAFRVNPLLKLFARHMTLKGDKAWNLGDSDHFREEVASDLGVDEWLAVRVALGCRTAPYKVGKGKGEGDSRIPNRWPIAMDSARHLRQDLMTFIDVYGPVMPRQAFLPMLESGIALGMTNIILGTTACLFEWDRTGEVPSPEAHWPLFVDCSLGQDVQLRRVSESVMAECAARYERLPMLMMTLRILDERARYDRKLRNELPAPFPDARPRLNLLGALIHERHARADSILNGLDEDCLRLAEKLEESEESPEAIEILMGKAENPARRIAEAMVQLVGDNHQGGFLRSALESCVMSDRPNGLAMKRRVPRTEAGARRSVDMRAIVVTNPMLDFLVHRHLRKDARGKAAKPLSLRQFLDILYKHYGLYVDREPPGMSVPQGLLRENKRWLERRLRDLGLLVGVNDAESMKQLRTRFAVPEQVEEAADDATE
ncbi:MAG: hypothetical protein A3F74_14450 [Betaproteobacteria bacterium RIFCSPLOWO2_12_FULL_62_58]|nr:MAG: hypothetical protein A3F74_14450 [Betaproteobacteria bacterium RIFCSPLOWO2_12_FULL_62_58]